MTNQQSIDKLLSLSLWLDKDSELYQSIAMAISALRAQEPQELSKNSPKLDKENGDLQPTCNQLATDCISRQAAINAADRADYTGLAVEDVKKVTDEVVKEIKKLPPTHPEIEERKEESAQNVPKEDLISRKAAIDAFITSTSDGDKADWCKWVLEQLPPAESEIIHCKDCKHYKAYEYTGRLACHYVIGGTVVRNPNDFCSRAERITNERSY
jgi:hypothetical protein